MSKSSIFKNYIDVGFQNKFNHFEYEKFPIIGVGADKLPIVPMDKYIEKSNNMEIFYEICKSLAVLSTDRKMGMISGTLHPSEREKGHINFTEMLNNMDYYDPTGIHTENIKDLESKKVDSRSIYTYMYFAMGAHIPWYFNYSHCDNDICSDILYCTIQLCRSCGTFLGNQKVSCDCCHIRFLQRNN